MLQKSKECEVKFSITYLNRNAREPSQTKSTKNKNYRKDDTLINNCPPKKKKIEFVCVKNYLVNNINPDHVFQERLGRLLKP